MNRFAPHHLGTKEGFLRFENVEAREFVVQGDNARYNMMWRVVDHLETLSGWGFFVLPPG
jgi:hypothetical protein